MRHAIRRQCLEVAFDGSEADGVMLHRMLAALCRESVTATLEPVLDRQAPPDRHLCIERLVIDVGSFAFGTLERDLPEAIARTLQDSLAEILVREGRTPAPLLRVERKSSWQKLEEGLIRFLETGSLPWWFEIPRGKSLEDVLLAGWQESPVAEVAPPVGPAVASCLRVSVSRRRLVAQFSPLFLEKLLSFFSEELDALKDVMKAVPALSGVAAVAKELERELWDAAVVFVARGERLSEDGLICAALHRLPTVVLKDAGLAAKLEDRWPLAMDAIRRMKTLGAEGASPVAGSASHPSAPEPVGEASALPEARGRRQAGPEETEGIFVGNAGTVLLHPFLPTFFGKVGVADGENLLQPERAVALLHLLATGQTSVPEYEVPLFKILCGLPLDRPLPYDVGLTGSELDEGDLLLKAAVGHWEALRNTSPDGLRGTFLVRPGKLSRRDEDWLLQVEPQSCDILLDDLPWGISMVKLPWMETMLWVEWR